MIKELISEFSCIDIGDKRLDRRATKIVSRICENPALSFPAVFSDSAELEGFYRFIENPYIQSASLLEPHQASTLERVKSSNSPVCIHDTTRFTFSGSKDGMPLSSSNKTTGVDKSVSFGHISLVVDFGNNNEPLGVIRLRHYQKGDLTRRSLLKAGKKQSEVTHIPSELERWWKGIDDVRSMLPMRQDLIHACDSEADSYELLTTLLDTNTRFVIRACHDRYVVENGKAGKGSRRLRTVVKDNPVVAVRTVQLNRRKRTLSTKQNRNQARTEREATLEISAQQVSLPKTHSCSKGAPRWINVNVVHISERNPPQDVEPIEWIIYTSEPIGEPHEILRVVDIYRSRWLIEEYFKALKTGCSYEDRELRRFENLDRCLALLAPIAWWLLKIRHASRQPGSQRIKALPEDYLQVLKLALPKKTFDTLTEQITGIALLGGHLKSNGPPGWLVIWRGFWKLTMLVQGYQLAKMSSLYVN